MVRLWISNVLYGNDDQAQWIVYIAVYANITVFDGSGLLVPCVYNISFYLWPYSSDGASFDAFVNDAAGIIYMIISFADDLQPTWLLTYDINQQTITHRASMDKHSTFDIIYFFSAQRAALYGIVLKIDPATLIISIDKLIVINPITGQYKNITSTQTYPGLWLVNFFPYVFDDVNGILWFLFPS